MALFRLIGKTSGIPLKAPAGLTLQAIGKAKRLMEKSFLEIRV